MQNGSQHSNGFIVQPFRRSYLNEYFKRMSQDREGVLYDDNVAAVLKDQEYSIEESPRSIYRVRKLYEALQKYRPGNVQDVDLELPAIKAGISFAYASFGRPKDRERLDPLAFTVEMIDRITTNKAGSPGLTAWGQTKAESKLRAHQRGLQIIRNVKKPEPCIAFTRTQFNEKTRLVWGYPYSVTAIEGMFARPLIENFKTVRTPMAFGITTLEIGCRLRVSSYNNQFAYSTDYSGYDATISQNLLKTAFEILSSWLNLSLVEPNTGVVYKQIWNKVVNYFIRTPIVMPDGNVYYGKKHGIPSGSYFTQLIGSIVNAIIMGAVSYEFKLNVSKKDTLLLGDDILYWSNRAVDQAHISRFITRIFGIKTNADKSGFYKWNEVVHFLGRDWERGVPSLPQSEILKRMVFVETFRKYSKDKYKREREVRMLLLSYASVYRQAFSIYIRGLGQINRYSVPNVSIEEFVYSINRRAGPREMIGPDKLSGLQRFNLKYNRDTGGETPSLALQFLK